MAIFRVGYFPDFDLGDAVVLVAADRDGMRTFQCAVRSAHEDGAASFEFDAIKHSVVRQDGGADIELGPHTVVWRFDDAQLVEMLDLIEPLVDTEGPGHQYVDLNSPVDLLILSVDEYTHGGPFAAFPHGLPVPRSVDSQRSASTIETGPSPGALQVKPPPASLPTEQVGTERA